MGHEACIGMIRSVCSFGQKLKRREHLRPIRRRRNIEVDLFKKFVGC
jgi:hypothetical protein